MLRGSLFFFFNDPATTEIYPLSLHDALPISQSGQGAADSVDVEDRVVGPITTIDAAGGQLPVLGQTISVTASTSRSEEHTSELQSRLHLVCRLLLEKKKS